MKHIYKSYGYYGYPYWGYGRGKRLNKSYEEEYLEDLFYYGKTIGVDKETITELLELGYDYMDIEDMLYEFDCYGEDDFCAEI